VINELTNHDTRIAANATAIKVNEELETLRHETVINELTGHDTRITANATAISENQAAVAGLNQRLDKTNAKINKVGAGAAALAALHPLEYDPDDKLTFSAGMGNYAGENAAALGAFYRPNEKFMVSLGGTMGNGENMVNLGLSIGLDKPNGYAKLSKRELIQKVNVMEAKYEQVEAENEAMKDQLANADERIAKLEALVAQLVKK
jgi:chromosome segregation ATPase